jgi:uncharacterized protein HemX
MPGAARSEIIFIAAMMILILIISGAAVYLFLRQYRREMTAKISRKTEQQPAEMQNQENEKPIDNGNAESS